MRRIAVLDAPSNLGLRPPTATSVPGCAKAPGALRDQGLLARLGARDAGCLTPPRYDPGDWRPGDGVAHAPEIAAYSRALADRIGAILDNGEFPVVLGGDCSILIGSGIAMHRLGDAVGGRIGLVFVDGHSDFRHPGNASYVGAAAGEDLALVTGRGQADLAAIESRRPYFRDIDVVVLGIRAQDEYRLDLQAAGIITRPVPALRAEGAARSAQWARDQLVDCAGYWVHIDVDVLDPAVMPAVDAPDPGGIAFPELELLLSGLVDSPHCLGVEITVFDPDYDPDGRYAAEITSAVVGGLSPVRDSMARPDLVAARLDLETQPSAAITAVPAAPEVPAAAATSGLSVTADDSATADVSAASDVAAISDDSVASGVSPQTESPAGGTTLDFILTAAVSGRPTGLPVENPDPDIALPTPAADTAVVDEPFVDESAVDDAIADTVEELPTDEVPPLAEAVSEQPPDDHDANVTTDADHDSDTGEALSSEPVEDAEPIETENAATAEAGDSPITAENGAVPEDRTTPEEDSVLEEGSTPEEDSVAGEGLAAGESVAAGEETVAEEGTVPEQRAAPEEEAAPDGGSVPADGPVAEEAEAVAADGPAAEETGALAEEGAVAEEIEAITAEGVVSDEDTTGTEAESVAADEMEPAAAAEEKPGETAEEKPEEAVPVNNLPEPDRGGHEVRLLSRPLGSAPLLDSEPLPATRPGMLRPRPPIDPPAAGSYPPPAAGTGPLGGFPPGAA